MQISSSQLVLIRTRLLKQTCENVAYRKAGWRRRIGLEQNGELNGISQNDYVRFHRTHLLPLMIMVGEICAFQDFWMSCKDNTPKHAALQRKVHQQ